LILTTNWWWQKIRERLEANIETSQRYHLERFNIQKLNELAGKDQYNVEVLNMFAALEDLTQKWRLIKLGKRFERI
jgi:hypothetical protein